MKLAMTANEIKQRHRNGASVQILADLNNTSKEIIRDVLKFNLEKEKIINSYNGGK